MSGNTHAQSVITLFRRFHPQFRIGTADEKLVRIGDSLRTVASKGELANEHHKYPSSGSAARKREGTARGTKPVEHRDNSNPLAEDWIVRSFGNVFLPSRRRSHVD
jgi:hypothetical protein